MRALPTKSSSQREGTREANSSTCIDLHEDVKARASALEAVFDAVRERWGRFDFVFHSIASARKEDLQGRLVNGDAGYHIEGMVSH